MTNFRHFINSDPPKLLNLFRQSRQRRAFASPESTHALEIAVFGLPYFDPQGLIIAEEDGVVVGFVHAGFGFNDSLNGLDYSQGVISVILVSQDQQGKGIGVELVRRAEQYLLSRGATSIQAGQSRFKDPFYFGIYGGARTSGFLESDLAADPFFKKLGYLPTKRVPIFQRDMTDRKDPMNIRLMTVRRQTELEVSDQPEQLNWWWRCRFGNLESMWFQLTDKKTGHGIASLSVVGLDHYINAWQERAIGLINLRVEEGYREQGYAQALIVETIRRLRTEMITRAEIHVPESFPGAVGAVLASGFSQVDCGVVYQKETLPALE